MIEPRTLKGFHDCLPAAMLERERVIDTARTVYRSYGYAPIDTPVLEYLDILLGKGGQETDRQLYRFEDHGGRQVGMRFDLTVPLARFVAQHAGELGLPFKRYHIAKVWRGENTQHGRYREFMQCDFDTLGTESPVADTEMILVIHDLLRALGLQRYTVRINHRKLLASVLELSGLTEQTQVVLRALDKLAKIGPKQVAAEMRAYAGATEEQAAKMLQLTEIRGTPGEVLQQVEKLVRGSEIGQIGLHTLRQIVQDLQTLELPAETYTLDLSIARGLDYYSGTVVETLLWDLPQIGSICSGGRYDDLAGLYTKQRIPGVGASLGLDRLMAALESLGLAHRTRPPTDVLIAYFDEEFRSRYLQLARRLRQQGITAELYPEPKKIGQQLKYAATRNMRLVVIAGEQEFQRDVCQIKDLERREALEVSLAGSLLESQVAELLR